MRARASVQRASRRVWPTSRSVSSYAAFAQPRPPLHPLPCVRLNPSIARESSARAVLYSLLICLSPRAFGSRCSAGCAAAVAATAVGRDQVRKASHKIKNETDFWPEQVETGRYSAPSKLHIHATSQTNKLAATTYSAACEKEGRNP
jgi:hypothetical protein